MSELDRVYKEGDALSGQLSANTRYVAFGLLAFVYTLLTSDAEVAQVALKHWPRAILLVAVLSIATLLADSIQYAAGYLSVLRAINRKDDPGKYNKKWWQYRVRMVAFWAKHLLAVAGGFLLICVLSTTAWTMTSSHVQTDDVASTVGVHTDLLTNDDQEAGQ